MQSNWTKIADRKMGEDPEALRRAVAHYADRVPGSVSSEAPVSTRASVSTSPQSQFTPPEGSTGLANQVQTREIESGLLSREPEKGDTMSRRDIHAMGAAMPSVEEAEKLGKRIASGSEPFNRRSVALAQEGKRLFVKQLKDARRETSQAIERGEPPEAVNGLRDHVAALEKRLGDYLDDIQKGKTGWAQTGHALQIGTKVDTGEYDDVIQAAQTAKGSKLTDAEKQRYREAVDELNDLKERHAKLGAENEKQSSRIANLEKALAKETRAAKSFPKARVSVRRTQGAKLIQEGKDDFRKAIANISFGSTGGGRQRGATVLPIPENTPEILEAVGKITKGVIQSGVGTLEDVYAKVNEALAEHGYSATKEQIHAAFAKVASRVGAMSEDQRRRAALSTMLRLHAKIDEALSGAAKDPEKAARMAADPEIVELREQLKSLQGGDPIEKSFQDKLDAALKRLAKPKVPRSDVQGPPTEKAAAIKKELDDLRSGLARDRRTSGLKKKLAELDAKIKTRDTSKSPRNQPQFTGDQERLRQEIKTKQKQIEAMIEADRKQTTAERVGGYVQRAVITRIPTLGKLLSASAWHHPVEAINDAMGYATSKLPAGGGKTLGELNPSAAGGGATTARLKSLASPRLNWTRALPSLRGGINEIDAAAGKIYGGRLAPIRTMGQKAKLAATDLLVHPERLHAGEKAMTIQGPQFDAALRREMSYAKAHGIEPTPGNIDAMRNRAALEAQNAILRSDNKAANFVNRNIESALRSKHVGERAAGLVGRLVFPITRMGFNFASETAQLTGIPQIEMAIGHAVKVGIMKKEITPEEAAVLGRAYKRLGPAAVALYIAATQPKWFQVGKFYQGPPKKGEPTEDLAPGEVRLFGVKMPRVFTHSPFVYSVMFWSTLLHGKGDLEKRAGNTALGASEAIPGEMAISEGSRDVEAGNPHLGRAIARIAEPAIPGILQQAAESSDMQQGSALGHMFLGTGHPRKRDTTAYWGAGQIMSEIPGLRGKVPEEGPKKPPKRRPPKLRVH
jgi:hypothetical protein